MYKRLLLFSFVSLLHAGTYTVDSNTDTGAGAGTTGDLRYVINQLNDPLNVDPDSQIVFNLGAGMETISLSSPLPNLNVSTGNPNLTLINGLNAGPNVIPITVDGGTLYPGFVIDQFDDTFSTFTIQDLTLNHCLAVDLIATGGSIEALTPPALPITFVLDNVQLLNSVAQGEFLAVGGAAVIGLPVTIQGSATIDGTAQSPTLAFGWSLFSTQLQLNPNAHETISFTDSFQVDSTGLPFAVDQNGPGTVSLQTTSTEPPNQTFDPAVYLSQGGVDIEQGTFRLQGQVSLVGDILFPSPMLIVIPSDIAADFTLRPGATLSGGGLIIVNDAINIQGTIQPDPGVLYLVGTIQLQAGSQINVGVSPSAASAMIFSDTTVPSLNIQQATLSVDIQPGTYPGGQVYALCLSETLFDGKFQDIIVTSNGSVLYSSATPPPSDLLSTHLGASDATILYSPQSAPNSILFPVNVPYGISTANIVLGTVSIPSTVLYDPCAGIIVISLLAPGEGAAALSAFFGTACTVTAKTLADFTATLNAQCLSKGVANRARQSGPVAQWYKTKNLIFAQNSRKLRPLIADMPKESPEEEPATPSSPAPPAPSKPPPSYSLSFTAMGQFQQQDVLPLTNAIIPAYKSKTGAGILGLDYLGLETILIGGATSFAWTDVTIAEGAGGQQTWSVFGTVYSSFIFDQFFFNLLATGSYNHNSATRNFTPLEGDTLTIQSNTPFGIQSVYTFQTATIPGGTARAKFSTYQLTPHIDLNYEIGFGFISLVPFIMSDCSISFSGPIVETGDNFLNANTCGVLISLNTATASLTSVNIQSAAGANLFEQIDLKERGILIFRQKASYVNRYTVPYTVHSKLISDTEYVETALHFPVQHMFGGAAEMAYRWKNLSAVLSYECIVGSGYLSNTGSLRLAYDF